MPFYDLRCSECGGEFNISPSMTDKTEKCIPCPECGSFDLQTVYKAAPPSPRTPDRAGKDGQHTVTCKNLT